MEFELDRLPKEVNNKKNKTKNQLARNSLFEMYFPGKTQPNNSKSQVSVTVYKSHLLCSQPGHLDLKVL